MKEYRIIFVETVEHEFYIEANSEDEAAEEFYRMADRGELDFSDGYVRYSEVESIEEY